MNMVDTIYFDLYTLIDQVLLGGFLNSMGLWRPMFIGIATIAVTLIGYKLMYSERPNMLNSFKQLAVVMFVFLALMNPQPLLAGLKFVFITFPMEAGQITISGIMGGLNMTGNTLDLQPSAETTTAFGAMWDFTTDVAERMFSQAGLSQMGYYLWGALFFVIGFLMVVVQLIIMASALLLSTAVIFGAPVFGWMLMFKQTKPMFEKWLSIGMTSSIMIFLLIVVLGILLSFMNQGIITVFGIDMFDPAQRGEMADPDKDINFQALTSVALFLALGVKLLPKVETWATSIGGIAAGSISDAAMSVGAQISDKLGFGAAAGAQKLHAGTSEASRKAGEKTGEMLRSARDRVMAKRMDDIDSDNMATTNKGDAGFSNRSDVNSLSFDDDSSKSGDTATKETATGESKSETSEKTETRRAETPTGDVNQNTATGEAKTEARQTTVNQGDKVDVNNRQETTVKKSDDAGEKATARPDPKPERQEVLNKSATGEPGQNSGAGSRTGKTDSGESGQKGGQSTHTKEVQRQTVTKETDKSGDNLSGGDSGASSKPTKEAKRQDSKELEGDKYGKATKSRQADRVESKDLKDD
jgi:type IV secretory pathway VirB6-like protein